MGRSSAAEIAERGAMLMDPARSSIVVAGIVRDGAGRIQAEVQRLARALRPFRRVQWLIVESDSADSTLVRLSELEEKVANFRFISLGRLREKVPQRTQRIAFCRNAYLEELRSGPGYEAVDFVMVADLDGTNSLVNETAILSCWARTDWHVCTANQRGPYYDVWALRHPDWSPNDCWAQYRFLVRHGVGLERARSVAVHSRMVRIEPDAEWIEVQSAFGGLAIYRRHALDDGEYVGVDLDGREICEHLSLHAVLRTRGQRIFINPQLINTAYTEHTAAVFVRNRMVRIAKRVFRQAARRGERRDAAAVRQPAAPAKA